MEKLSQLAYHPLKMQSCYEKMEPLRLDGLQQRFDVSSTSVFKQRAQIHMREVCQRPLPFHTPVSWQGPRCLAPPSSGAALQPCPAPVPACSGLQGSPICLEHLFLCSPG